MHDDHVHYEGDGCGFEHIEVSSLAHDPDEPPLLVAGAPLAEVGQIAVLRLQPGDRLAVTTDRPLSQEGAARIRAGVADWASVPVGHVVLLDDGLELTVLRPDEEEDPDA